MKTIDPDRSTLLVVDFQQKLMPAIDGGEAAVRNARRLLDGAALIGVPAVFTEQYPKGLGTTVGELAAPEMTVVEKTHFDAARAPRFYESLPADRVDMVVAGCEAHVCVLQTVLGLLDTGRKVFVAADAIGSRAPANKDAAIARMQRHGAEIVTTEMVLFEWLVSSDHPRFKEAMALIR